MARIILGTVGLIILLLAAPLNASLPINTELIRKSVIFIYGGENRETPSSNRLLGTGFLVAFPLESNPEKMKIVLVTARHVIQPQWAGCRSANPHAIHLRVNKKTHDAENDESGVKYLFLPLISEGRRTWYAHTDDRVDVAVIPVNARVLVKYDIHAIRLREFGTEEEIGKVKVGDSIVSAGVVPFLARAERNYPAFKFGKVSSILDEPVQTRCCEQCPPKRLLLWFLAANFVPANSGSPIFFIPFEFNIRGIKGRRAMLLGVLSSRIGGADLGGMISSRYVFEVVRDNIEDVVLYRGKQRQETESEDNQSQK